MMQIMSLKKPKCLSLHEKSLVIQDLNNGARVTYLSRKYGVAKSTICKIKQNKLKIVNAVMNTYSGPTKRKTLKGSELPRMEKRLYGWFLAQRNKNIMVSDKMIKQQAKLLHSQLKEVDKEFTASAGWLQRFKKRFGIGFLNISDEKLSSQSEFVGSFKIHLNNKIQELGITFEQLYSVDELGLCWKLLSDRTAPDKKTEKQRITFLASTNASGSHKVKPLVISRIADPVSFTNCVSLVDYEYSKSACMTTEILQKWFHSSFVPQVTSFLRNKGLPIKALLLLDSALSHPSEEELRSEDGNILTMYLPPNVTSLIHSMDQNILGPTKLYYRNSLLATLIANDSDITDALKNVTIKDAVINLTSAWNRLEPEVITRCWRAILLLDDILESEDHLPLAILKLQWDNNASPLSESLVPQVIFQESNVLQRNNVKNERGHTSEGCESDLEENVQESANKVLLDSAIDSLNITIQWARENDVDITDLIVLKRLREKAILKKTQKLKKHTNISNSG